MRIVLFFTLFFLGLGVLGWLYIKIFIPEATISSWWRTPWHNKEIGGMEWSHHQIGLAFDLVPVSQEIGNKLRKLFGYVLNENTHWHCQFWSSKIG